MKPPQSCPLFFFSSCVSPHLYPYRICRCFWILKALWLFSLWFPVSAFFPLCLWWAWSSSTMKSPFSPGNSAILPPCPTYSRKENLSFTFWDIYLFLFFSPSSFQTWGKDPILLVFAADLHYVLLAQLKLWFQDPLYFHFSDDWP